VVAEATISSVSLASIAMEDITPLTESASSGQAPEEVRGKKRGRQAALVADEELTSADRKRLRNASKATRRKERKDLNYKEAGAAQFGKSSHKYESQKTDEILRSDKRVTVGQEKDTNQYAKSGQFFERLQAQAQTEIAEGKALKKKKAPAAPAMSSSRYKS